MIPEGWNAGSLSDYIASVKSGLSRKISIEDIGLPVVTSTNIQNGRLDTATLKYWYVDDPQGANTADYVLSEGDILLNFINSAAQIGKSCLFRSFGRPTIYTTNIFRIKIRATHDVGFA